MQIVSPGGRGAGLNLSTNISVKLNILPSKYVKLDGVAPLITDPPPTSPTTLSEKGTPDTRHATRGGG